MEGMGKFLFLSGRLSRTKGLALLHGLWASILAFNASLQIANVYLNPNL